MSLLARLLISQLLLLARILSRSSSSHSPSSSLTTSLSPSPSSASAASLPMQNLKVFHANTSELQRLVFDEGSGRFLLAGTNGIFSLDLNFNPLQQVVDTTLSWRRTSRWHARVPLIFKFILMLLAGWVSNTRCFIRRKKRWVSHVHFHGCCFHE